MFIWWWLYEWTRKKLIKWLASKKDKFSFDVRPGTDRNKKTRTKQKCQYGSRCVPLCNIVRLEIIWMKEIYEAITMGDCISYYRSISSNMCVCVHAKVEKWKIQESQATTMNQQHHHHKTLWLRKCCVCVCMLSAPTNCCCCCWWWYFFVVHLCFKYCLRVKKALLIDSSNMSVAYTTCICYGCVCVCIHFWTLSEIAFYIWQWKRLRCCKL